VIANDPVGYIMASGREFVHFFEEALKLCFDLLLGVLYKKTG